MSTFLESASTSALKGIVTSFWSLENESGCESAENVFPDGHVEWTFNLGDPFIRLNTDGTLEKQASSLLIGQMKGPVRLLPKGKISLFGIRFHPAGAPAVVSVPIVELTGGIQDLTHLVPGIRDLMDQLAEAQSFDARVMIAQSFLLKRVELCNSVPDLVVQEIVSRLSVDFRPTERITRNFGLSYRQVERRFLDAVGISPKWFSRIARFQHVFQSMQGHADWSWHRALEHCNYFDQAHFIREFRQLSGQTPSAYALCESRLSAFFTEQYRMSEIYNTKRRQYAILHAQD